MGKYLSRITSSARGETFNPLIWPALIATTIYGVGFSMFFWVETVSHSSLFAALTVVHAALPPLWGAVALLTVIVGFTFLLFNKPPAGKVSGLIGFMVWVFACFAWALTGGWFVSLAVGLPNMWFWIWQYLSLAKFRKEDEDDREFLAQYHRGEYDDEDNPKDARRAREDNRGVDEQ